MSRHRIAAIVIFLQAIALPIISGSLGGADRGMVIFLQVALAGLCWAVFAEKKWALWIALALMAIQVPVVEADFVTWRVTAGSALSVGLLKSASWLDSRIGLNVFAGYVYNGAIFHVPAKRMFTGADGVSEAFMLNLTVLPALILLGVRKRAKGQKGLTSR